MFSRGELVFREAGLPRYEQLAHFIEDAIAKERLNSGDRLPTVRQLSSVLGVSVTTVTAAFNVLTERGLIRAEVGRGTFVSGKRSEPPAEQIVRFPRSVGGFLGRTGQAPWRRKTLTNLAALLRTAHPDSTDCSTGRPDPMLLPLGVVQRAWRSALDSVTPRDMQYAGPEAIQPLSDVLVPLLEADLVPARREDLVVGSSAQQFMALALDIAAGLCGSDEPAVAVEEPGYPTIMDTYERAGARLIGMEVDEYGAVPESLDKALKNGAKAALFTPRAHNPTGASWTTERAAAIADVLAGHPDVLAIEDDQFAGISFARPGSLMADVRLEDRVIYIRSFSKSIGPDLRLAVAVTRPRLRTLLLEAKVFADGWTSRLLQRTLVGILRDPELFDRLEGARSAYRERRERAADAINAVLCSHGAGTWCGPDGLNLWVHLPAGVDAADVVQRAAAEGVRVAPGEPFYLRPGHGDAVRMNAGSVPADKAVQAARLLAQSVLACGWKGSGPIHV